MTKSNDATSNTTVTEVPAEKKSVKQRLVAPIKKHPKIAIAIAAGVALVAGASLLGKDSLNVEDLETAELEPVDDNVSLTPES